MSEAARVSSPNRTVTGLVTESTPEVAYEDDYNSNLIAGIVLLVVGVGFVLWARLRPVVVPVQEDDTAAH